MAVENLIEKLAAITAGKSSWLEQAKERSINRPWLKTSQAIAIRLNKALSEKKMTQKMLANMLSVSPQHINKICKGQENLTLETIYKLEQALNIVLLSMPKYNNIYSYKTTEYNKSTNKQTIEGNSVKSTMVELDKYIQAPKAARIYKMCA
jgi:plasmid maintenance system antidote protein VapI